MEVKDIELQIISSIESASNLSDLKVKGLRRDDFFYHKNLYIFICEQIEKYGTAPSKNLINAEFPEIQLPEPDSQSTGFFVDSVVKNSIKRGAESILSRAIDILQVDDPLKAIDYIGDHLFQLKRMRKTSRSYTDKDALLRYDFYITKRKSTIKGSPVGIKTGFNIFEERMIGWNPGNLILVVGYKGIGKSFLALKVGITAYDDGYSVVFVSPEMPINDVDLRWDTMRARQYNFEFSNEALTYGLQLDQEKYKEFLNIVSDRSDWITYDSADGKPFDIDSLESIADEHSPDLMVVDGLYLIRDEDGRVGDWSNMVTVSNKLKALATRKKMVIFMTSQAKDNEGRIAYSKYLSQPVDFMLWLAKNAGYDNVIDVTVQHMRSGRKPDKASSIKFVPDKGIMG